MGDCPPWRKGLLEVMVTGRGAAMTGVSRATQVHESSTYEPVRGVCLSADARLPTHRPKTRSRPGARSAATRRELTATLAHEMKQPITAIVTNADACSRWLTGDTPNLEQVHATIEKIVKAGTRAAEIVSRTRQFFEKGVHEREPIDIDEIIRETIPLLRSEATRYSISIRQGLAADSSQVMGDRVQLQQVILNLILNGIDAMKEVDGTRELTIKSQKDDSGQVVVSVSDTGIGLPAEQADQIFKSFFTTKPHGTGMGLSICRSIIEAHEGRLWAAPNETRGAVFQFVLPVKDESLS